MRERLRRSELVKLDESGAMRRDRAKVLSKGCEEMMRRQIQSMMWGVGRRQAKEASNKGWTKESEERVDLVHLVLGELERSGENA
eukprot:111938-Rhodomonas_salina.1